MTSGPIVRRARTGTMAVGVLLALVLTLTACGKKDDSSSAAGAGSSTPGAACQNVGSVKFDKTKLVLHAGLAFGAFHHWIYKPFKDGSFAKGAKGRTFALVKAGAAGLFTIHELSVAKKDAESSPTFCHLVAPLDKLSGALSGLKDKIKGGDASQSDMDSLNSDVTQIQNTSKSEGADLPDQVPSAGQLASPPN